jgi:4'-phosphopantetheinyl transferase EntD
MQIWKVTKTLSNPKDPEWKSLVKSSLGEGVHSNRKFGFMLSREALIMALKEAGYSCSIPHLKMEQYSGLKSFPQFTISLSHTKEAGAAVVADRQTFRSVGIDIEHEERLVKEAVIERVSHPGDLVLRNIEIWCLKEAAFKAIMNTGSFEAPVSFSSIQIEDKTWSHSPSSLQGEWELDIINQIVVARAFLKI